MQTVDGEKTIRLYLIVFIEKGALTCCQSVSVVAVSDVARSELAYGRGA